MPSKSQGSNRTCADCPADISGQDPRAPRCTRCKRLYHNALKRNIRRAKSRARPCRTCGGPKGPERIRKHICLSCEKKSLKAKWDRANERKRRPQVCRSCGESIADKPKGSRSCDECIRKRHRASIKAWKRRNPGSVIVSMPATWSSSFDTWLDVVTSNPKNDLVNLHHEPETWRPFVVPDYLK